MDESSLFPVFPTAYWAEKNAQGIALVWKKGHSEFFPFLSETISWRDLHQLLQQAVTFLQKNAISSTSLVAYVGSDRLVGLVCYLATLMLGSKILMLNPAMPAQQRYKILEENGVTHCFTDNDFLSENHFANSSTELTACISPFSPSSPATLTLTSGSSGTPKAVVHSIQHHLENAEGVCELMDFDSHHSWLLSLPLFHVSGQGIVWRWLLKGATLWINEKREDFWFTLSQVSHASLVPTQLQRYLNQVDSSNVKHQKILLGGAFIPAELVALAQTKQIETYSGYGMTEMASTICAVKNALSHVGKPLKGREVYIDEKDEIWVRGAGLGFGYWINQTIMPFTQGEGWFATKDKGYWNKGNLIVQGRLDNLFISGGENIQPEEVERILFQSMLIKQAFVLPATDEEFGQRPVAIVEFNTEFSPQAVRSLHNFASQYLEKFKLPVKYFPLEQSMQSGFKISRKQLQQYIALKLEEQQREQDND